MSKGNGRIVPLGIVADHGGGVLHAVRPFDVPAPPVGVENVTKNDEDRDAVGVRVIDRHGGVLKPYGAVSHHHHRLALDLGVTVGHGYGGFLVAAGDEFRTPVAAVIDQRFVKAAEARARIGRRVLESQRLDDVHHEIRPGTIGGIDVHPRPGRNRFGRGLGWRWQRQRLAVGGLLRFGWRSLWDHGRCRAGSRPFEESPPVHTLVPRAFHAAPSCFVAVSGCAAVHASRTSEQMSNGPKCWTEATGELEPKMASPARKLPMKSALLFFSP